MQAAARFPLPSLAHLSPAYFGLVMATGIVSIGAWRLGMPRLAWLLFAFNGVAYVTLWLLYLTRLARHPRLFVGDLTDHLRGPGFFTMVAASSIVGSQFLLLAGSVRGAIALLVVAVVLWLLLTYTIFTVLTVKSAKPSLAEGINGGWLLGVVATQSIAVLSTLLAAQAAQPWRLELNFLALSMWLWGGMLYIWMMSLIFYRYTFFVMPPGDLSPPYWINMGAMAISTLAGSLLSINATDAPFLLSLQPFVNGFTIFYWATGTWWIPMLLVLGVWRHLYRRFPLRYDPLYWGAVFPLGMYATSTFEMSQALGFPFLEPLARASFVVALAAWSLLFVGYLHAMRRAGLAVPPRA
ncbi:tellurite resistance/C4-dicarboxylate transporter family protein [Dokdonella sp.]|uniref:tellurite resistance/C4-dicarboxylate transporter family protein n=1 Tax=Dokdonella sp. TaxID=2291710 RepID=UPI0031C1BD5E|nr:tellurite resistance/C4-dicarboxylate transporter family protein [Dokdonella sp.]